MIRMDRVRFKALGAEKRLRSAGDTRVCTGCREELPADRFGPEDRSADGYAYTCRRCDREQMRGVRDRRAEYWLTHDPYSEHASKQKGCSICKRVLTLSSFSRDNAAASGLQRQCKECQINYWRKVKYGRSLEAGGSTCNICTFPRGLGVDHDHKTGRTRGNLCRACNTGLGQFGDDIVKLEAAISYLRKWSIP